MADKSTEVSKVTKPKNPGKVAQGHKLAELLKEKPQEQPQDESSLPNKSAIILTLGGVLGFVAYIVYDKVKKNTKNSWARTYNKNGRQIYRQSYRS